MTGKDVVVINWLFHWQKLLRKFLTINFVFMVRREDDDRGEKHDHLNVSKRLVFAFSRVSDFWFFQQPSASAWFFKELTARICFSSTNASLVWQKKILKSPQARDNLFWSWGIPFAFEFWAGKSAGGESGRVRRRRLKHKTEPSGRISNYILLSPWTKYFREFFMWLLPK